MISATLYGRIAKEPELVQPMTGRDAYVRFSMAVETGRKDENGNRIAQFVSISVFGKQGNTILQYFHKGNRIACHVRNLEARAYTVNCRIGSLETNTLALSLTSAPLTAA